MGEQVRDGRLDLQFVCRGVWLGKVTANGPFAGVHRLREVQLEARQVEFRALDAAGQAVDAAIGFDGAPLRVPSGLLRDQWVTVGDHTVADVQRDHGTCETSLVTETQVCVPAAGAIPPIVVRRRPSAAVRVRVLDADGAAVPFARVQAVEWPGEAAAPPGPAAFVAAARTARRATCGTDADGTARITGIGRGPVLVYVQGLPHMRRPAPHEFAYGKAQQWQVSPPPAGRIVSVRADATTDVLLQLQR